MTTEEKRRFWTERGLAEGDWLGLACCLLADYFSRDFLTPLQELDVVFSLEVKDWTLRRYMDLITKSRTKEELDLAKLVYPRRGSTAGRVDPTSLTFPNYSVEDFNPRSDVGGLFLPPPTAQMMNVDDRCKTLTLMTSASSGTGCSSGRNKDYNTIRWRRPRRDVDVLWHRREEEGLWRVRKRPPPPPDRPLLGHRLLLPHPTEVALLVLKKREDGGGGDVKAEKKSKKWDWWMIEDMG